MANSPYTIHNLPYGVVTSTSNPRPRCVVAYRDSAVDLSALQQKSDLFDHIPELTRGIFDNEHWNAFAALEVSVRQAFRAALKKYLLETAESDVGTVLIPLNSVQNCLPMDTRNFSDFFCSLEHTKNCCDIIGLKINPNWFAHPLVYNGRTSSLVVSGTPIVRPCGVFPDSSTGTPKFQPEGKLDFELEMGTWISKPVPHGQRINIEEAKSHIFGMTMLNDWSSRDIQFYEMQPLGPFHSKGSATTVSPWIVPFEALEELASCARATRQEPGPPSHLAWPAATAETKATFDVDVTVKLLRDGKTYTLGESNLNELHWTPFQQLTHLASAGAGLCTGDVFGTGTISSSRTNDKGEKSGLGCLWERKLPTAKLSSVPGDITDTMLKDGDEIVLEGWCVDRNTGEILLGFGECRGKVSPAVLP